MIMKWSSVQSCNRSYIQYNHQY